MGQWSEKGYIVWRDTENSKLHLAHISFFLIRVLASYYPRKVPVNNELNKGTHKN